ncbi:MAG: nitrate- and nitrite sensing domain-containing protein [Pseudomonadota bacterium]
MTILRSISLRTKLILMVLVPAAGLISMAYSNVTTSLGVRAQNSELRSLVELSVLASDMVHELQKERGMSAGYIGSRGAKFDQELSDQYVLSDTKIAKFQTYLNDFPVEDFGAAFDAALQRGASDLSRLATVRSRIRAFDITLAEGIGFYTATNQSFLRLVEFLPKLSSVGELSVGGTAYAAFLQSKERAGIERAVLANTFAKDRFSPGFFERFRALVNTQDVYLDTFRASASEPLKAQFQQLMEDPAVNETLRMRAVATERGATGGFGIDSTRWFAKQTQKINLLKQFEDQMAADLKALTQNGYEAASEQVTETMTAAGIPLLLAALLGIVISVMTLRELGADPSRLNQVVSAIANNDLAIDLTTKKRATGVFASAQVMQQNLRDRRDADQKMLAENGRIRKALTNVDGNVMISDVDNSIIYVNDAMQEFFGSISAVVQKELGNANARELMGLDIDTLHKVTPNSEARFSAITRQTSGRLTFGQHTIDWVANPVLADDGERIGTVFEWTDRTHDLAEEIRVQATLAENGRIREALTNVAGNVMIAGREQHVVYANDAMLALFADIKSHITRELPQVDSNSLMNADVDVLHKAAAGSQSFFGALNAQHEGRVTYGPITLDYVANPVFGADGERLGTVFEWTDRTADLAEEIRVQATLAENGRIRQALTNAVGNVMIAGPDGEIIFANNAMTAFFSRIQSDPQSQLGVSGTDALIGMSADQLHQSSSHSGSLANLVTAQNGEIQLGQFTIDYFASPVLSPDGERQGTVIEWLDRTTELVVKSEVQTVVNAALAGDLSQRIALEGKDGFFATLSESVNQLVTIAENVVDDTMRVFGAVAVGNLTETIDADYEGAFNQLKTDANQTIDKLTEVVRDIQQSAGSVKTAADEISQGNLDLSQRTESQASSLEQTASSMEEMTSTVQQNAQNAQQADTLARSAREQAERGGAVVSQAVKAMHDINESSKKIADIIGVIDEIAFQTNLLALNASVEAARAGEQGRGFAVVASEVRNLAGRSATAAKEIKELIEDSTQKVNIGSELVDESGGTLEDIVNGVKSVTTIVGEIAMASQEQSSGIVEVNKAIAQMDDLTQQNAALVEQAAAASQSLGEQATGLNRLMEFFSVRGGMQQTPVAAAVTEMPAQPQLATTQLASMSAGNTAIESDWSEF